MTAKQQLHGAMEGELQSVVRVLGAGGFRGTGVLVAPDRVLTCRHVVAEPGTNMPCLDLRVETSDGRQLSAKCPAMSQGWDLALLKLETAVPVSAPPILWGLTETLAPVLRRARIWVYGYPEVEATTLWQHSIKELFRLPAARQGTQILTQLQLTGGIPRGCSGGPALLR